MCGIAGYFSGGGSYFPPSTDQQNVLRCLASRGPDGSGRWQDPDRIVALLHRRLSIQDLSLNGAQPMHSHDGSLTIVFNGEIYNVDELRRWVPDYPFRGTSDTEVLLALYLAHGPALLQFLRGMFAFAIWNSRDQSLFLARDPYGIKPLYVAETPDGVWFSSQVKALLQLPHVDRAADPAGHAGFFLWGSVPEPYTLYLGIRSLRAGHSLMLQRGCAPVESRFCSIAGSLAAGAPIGSEETVASRLKSALADSVRAHFVADVPVAVFLSAGLDSSTLLGTAADEFPPEDLTALSLGFDAYDGSEQDETVQAAGIARHYGVPQRVDLVGKADFEAAADHFLSVMDQPTIDGINSYFVARMARQAGFKVAISGVGGDELFGGYNSFRRIPQMINMVSVAGVSRRFGGAIRRSSEMLLKRFTSPKFAGLLEYGGTVSGAYLLRRGLFMPWELPEVLDPEIAAAGLEELNGLMFEDSELSTLQHCPLHVQIAFLESTRYMRNQLLRDADWAGMAHSVEIRTPLVDQFLLTQMAAFVRSKRPPTKRDLANALSKPLPAAILNRPKTGFAVPVREWLTQSLPEKPERGLRSWARFVYRRQWTGNPEVRSQRTGMAVS